MEKTEALVCLQDWYNREPAQPGVAEMPQRVSAAVVEVAGVTPLPQEV